MSREVGRRLKSVFWNETGQMSVFVALIFQVLFVFFAMVINIGLLVHDKINLQNAVDLGAYYAAQRQAEILNEIAHINYQMRQDWKLLVWRYRVLGSMGIEGAEGVLNGTISPDDSAVTYGEKSARVCITHPGWKQYFMGSSKKTNLCQQAIGFQIPEVPQVQIIAPWVPGLGQAAASAAQARALQLQNYKDARPLNMAFAMYILGAYKGSIAIRKLMIRSLRDKLIQDALTDLSGEKVSDGVEKTVHRNLTQANEQTAQVSMQNGLAHPNCNGNNGEVLMPEILTAPVMQVVNIDARGVTSISAHLGQQVNQDFDYGGILSGFAKGEPSNPVDPHFSSLGFEKNPWCMAYVVVRATSKPRKPFSPFGEPVELVARAYAQPFGGRIGPWYGKRWPASAERSDGADVSQRVDSLTPQRFAPGMQSSAPGFPNYSRYPGDQLGLLSRRAIATQRHLLKPFFGSGRLDMAWWAMFITLPVDGDPLPWNWGDQGAPQSPDVKNLRLAETAAVAPDLFDITYYSIDPNYYQAYLQAPLAGFGMQRFVGKMTTPVLGTDNPLPIGDIGSRANSQLQGFNIKDQIESAWTSANGLPSGFDPSLVQDIYWKVKYWTHLLTSWAPHRAVNFAFPTDRFMNCDGKGEASDKVPIPGRCFAGGRTGYSVRLISRDHLLSPSWEIGGEGEAKGAILNPPGTNF